MILTTMGRDDLQPVILDEVRAEISVQHLSAARARSELSWQPRYSLEESLAETIEWYRRHLHRAPPAAAAAPLS
jgi:nucleoside-diphosphate-sugar epimerase